MIIKRIWARAAGLSAAVGVAVSAISAGATSQFATADTTIATLFTDMTTSVLALLVACLALAGLVYLIKYAVGAVKKASHGRV